ncbi:MAG: hypothetical protein QM698_17300 [Micropepsaceae bacterium]
MQAAFAEEAAPRVAPGITIPSDGFLVHTPSGLRLPREIRGPARSHDATITVISPDKVELHYGPITVTIGAPMAAADPVIVPPGWQADPDQPSLPRLLFWGEGVTPLTVSFLHGADAPAEDWVSFSIVVDGWQIELSSLYPPGTRDTVIHTAEAVWAYLASANAEPPRRPLSP